MGGGKVTMAEIEERIYIDVENDNLDRLKHLSMTRQEAIERMAKALRSNIVETQAQCSCLNMAEAALNALLDK